MTARFVGHCIKAAEKDAISVLLIADSLFRSTSIVERKKFVSLVEKVKYVSDTRLCHFHLREMKA